MAKEYITTLDAAYKTMGYPPSDYELNRLVKYYQTYNWLHRTKLLKGFFSGKSVDELVDDKLKVIGKTRKDVSRWSIGGHKKWVLAKIEKTIIRLMFLRYSLDKDYTREKSNEYLLADFPSKKNAADPTSNIRNSTRFILKEPPLPKFLSQ